MKCRMCSQRLTRPGRLCRECERELERARSTAASVGDLSSAVPLSDAARMATVDPVGWTGGFRARPTVVVAAFSVGITIAAALHVVQGSQAGGKSESVMIDRDLRSVRPREYRVPADVPVRVDNSGNGVAQRNSVPASQRREPVVHTIAPTASRSPAAMANQPRLVPAAAAAVSVPAAAAAVSVPAAATAVSEPAPAAYDRVLGLADALDTCSHESLFARIACEHRARTRYCDGATSRIPQCAEQAPREYGP